MAQLPDPYDQLSDPDRAAWERMADVRSHAEGRPKLGEVYVRMFNNPGVAKKVGALGEHLRFDGVLPDEIRELVILRFAASQKFGYEFSHHERPAMLAGLSEEVIAALGEGQVPEGVGAVAEAVIGAVDAVVAHASIPDEVQAAIVDAFGYAGVVEVVALCGLYGLMGYTVTAFDIPVEEGLPQPPFP